MYRYRLIAAFMALTVTCVLSGCGGSGDEQPTDDPAASIPAPGTPADTAAVGDGSSVYDVPPTADPAGYATAPVDPNSPYANLAAPPPIQPTANQFADTQYPVVQLNTNFGPVTIQLDAQAAPRTVTNFLNHVMLGHYDGTIFHEVLGGANRLIIGGGYTTELSEKSPYSEMVPNEAVSGKKNLRGTIAMARRPENVHSATCQFFFNVTDNAVLDHTAATIDGFGYCVFGEVTSGLDIIDRIADSQVRQHGNFQYLPTQMVVIETATRIR